MTYRVKNPATIAALTKLLNQPLLEVVRMPGSPGSILRIWTLPLRECYEVQLRRGWRRWIYGRFTEPVRRPALDRKAK